MSGPDKKVLVQAAELAEKGQYEQALGLLQSYLKEHPQDPEALNDAGTILYCLHRGQEAIEYFQKARSLSRGEILAQVLFNLCEAYLAERCPEEAVGLLDEMTSHNILNVDTLNRIAQCFVDKNALGPAIEMLLYSLRLAPNQEILRPMLEIIRSRRAAIFLYGEQERRLEGLQSYLQERYRVYPCIGGNLPAVGEGVCRQAVSIFAGISRALLDSRYQRGPSILFLDYEDLGNPAIEQIDWTGIQALFVPCTAVAEQIRQRLGTIPSAVRVGTIGPSVDAESIGFLERKKGKRLAAVGPWTAHHNPMFLLHCMQKLHYLDADMRLYLAGEFEDESVRQYVESMIEAMGLDNAVFLDGVPRNWQRWLKDKHYIVSAAVDGRAMPSVLCGMAAGLRPVVHQFPGASEFVEPQYQFLLAEDFCRQILEGAYEPQRYREWVVDHYSPVQIYLPLVRVLSEMEHQLMLQSGGPRAQEQPTFKPASAEYSPACRPVPISSPVPSVKAAAEPPVPSSSSTSESEMEETIEELARKALEAAQRLSSFSGKVGSAPAGAAACSSPERSPSASPF